MASAGVEEVDWQTDWLWIAVMRCSCLKSQEVVEAGEVVHPQERDHAAAYTALVVAALPRQEALWRISQRALSYTRTQNIAKIICSLVLEFIYSLSIHDLRLASNWTNMRDIFVLRC